MAYLIGSGFEDEGQLHGLIGQLGIRLKLDVYIHFWSLSQSSILGISQENFLAQSLVR